MEAELTDILDIDMAEFGFDEDAATDGPNAIDIEAEDSANDPDMTACHCPKCGFVFEVRK